MLNDNDNVELFVALLLVYALGNFCDFLLMMKK